MRQELITQAAFDFLLEYIKIKECCKRIILLWHSFCLQRKERRKEHEKGRKAVEFPG
jgi:hypothetical protein